jgi:hypothetical protein
MSLKTIFAGGSLLAVAGLGVWHVQKSPKPTSNEAELRAELARLRNEVRSVGVAQRAQMQALASRDTQVVPLANASAAVPQPVSQGKVGPELPKDPLERIRAIDQANTDAANRAGDQLDAYLASDGVDARWRSDTINSVNAVFADLPGKVLDAECGSHLCRVVVQRSSTEEIRTLASQIVGKAPFDQDVLYRYDLGASPPKVTLYVTRAGTQMASLVSPET